MRICTRSTFGPHDLSQPMKSSLLCYARGQNRPIRRGTYTPRPYQYNICMQYMYTCACRSWRVLVAWLLEMDPRVSATILGLLDRVPGAESLPQRFPLLFSNVAQTSTAAPKQPSTSASQVSLSAIMIYFHNLAE